MTVWTVFYKGLPLAARDTEKAASDFAYRYLLKSGRRGFTTDASARTLKVF